MANCSWFERFPAGRSEYLRFEGSDHRPVVVHFDVAIKKKRACFVLIDYLKRNQKSENW